MTTLTCDELRSLAAEVALGILSGAERADALGHMEHCVGCRVLVEGLAQTGDSLLLLAPEAEPPLGFESGVIARLGEGEPPQVETVDRPEETAPTEETEPTAQRWTPALRPVHDGADHRTVPGTRSARRARTVRRRRAVVAVAAVAIALVGGTAAAVSVIDHAGGATQQKVADQTPLRFGKFQAGDGTPVGHVYAYEGNPSWVFMDVDTSGTNGDFTCELQMANGTTVPIGNFDLHDGVGEWGHTIAVNVSQIKAARLVSPDGLTLATAALS